MIDKQDFHKNKEKEIDYLFLGYLIPVMEDLGHPALIEEFKQNMDAAVYEKNYTKM